MTSAENSERLLYENEVKHHVCRNGRCVLSNFGYAGLSDIVQKSSILLGMLNGNVAGPFNTVLEGFLKAYFHPSLCLVKAWGSYGN